MSELLKRYGQSRIESIEKKQINTSDLFKEHFGDRCSVDLKHPQMESFFDELNQICIEEDRIKFQR